MSELSAKGRFRPAPKLRGGCASLGDVPCPPRGSGPPRPPLRRRRELTDPPPSRPCAPLRPGPEGAGLPALPAAERRAPISIASSSIQAPRLRPRGSSMAPYRMRINRLTAWPTASNMRRTSRLRPSEIVTRYQQLAPSPPPGSIAPNWATPSSRRTPPSNLAFSSLLKAPSTRTAYSRSKPKRGCIRLFANSPELVNSSNPSVLRSSRPTDCHLPWSKRGRRRKTVGRFCGSSWVTTSPTGLW